MVRKWRHTAALNFRNALFRAIEFGPKQFAKNLSVYAEEETGRVQADY